MAGQKDLVSPAGSVGASAYFVCRGLRRRPAPLDTLRVPRFHFLHIQKTANTAKAVLAVLAGAEGIEPSALGFGVDKLMAMTGLQQQKACLLKPFLNLQNNFLLVLMIF